MFYNQDQVIKFIAAYVLPFLNAKDSAAKQAAFNEMYVDGLPFFFNDMGAFENEGVRAIALDNLTEDQIKYLGNVEKIHILITSMFDIALRPHNTIDKKQQESIENSIGAAIGSFYSDIKTTWKGPCECFCQYLQDDPFKRCESFLVSIIAELFYWRGLEAPLNPKGIGYTYFSVCPKCNRFFYRRRKDAEYCSERCRAAASTQRQRNKE